MNRQRMATISHLPYAGERWAMAGQIAQHLGLPAQHAAIHRRPWRWLNQYAKQQGCAAGKA